MPSTYSPSLRLELIATGEQAGTWGITTNNNIGTLIEQAIAGVEAVTMSDANEVLTYSNGLSDEARNAVLVLQGTLTGARDVICPNADKVYIVRNATSGGQSINFKTASGFGVSVPNGHTRLLYCDGTDVVAATGSFNPATNTLTANVAGNLTGTVTGNATNVTGVVAAANGGTGQSSYSAGQILIGNVAGGLSKSTLTAGSNVSITNGDGSITISAGSSLAGVTNSATPFTTALGQSAGPVTTGVGCTYVGYESGLNNSTGLANTAIGFNALRAQSTSGNNTALGYRALRATTTGDYNLAAGADAMLSATTAQYSVALGFSAIRGGNPYSAVAIGYNALYWATGEHNVAVGEDALGDCTTGVRNVSVGAYSSSYLTSGHSNTVVGYGSGDMTSGFENTVIGSFAGDISTGSNNTCVGYGANPSTTSVSNTITLGNSAITTLRCQATTITSLSDARDKTDVRDLSAGLSFVSALKPIQFVWNTRDGMKVGAADTGFIAQDLQQAMRDAGVEIPGLVSDDNPERLEASYGKLIPVLVKAIQELSARVVQLEARA